MTQYSFTEEEKDGTIKFWTNDEEIRKRVSQFIEDIIDAENYRRQLMRIRKKERI